MSKLRMQSELMCALYQSYGRLLRSVAAKYLDNPCDQEDVVQDVFVRAMGKAELLAGLPQNQQAAYLVRTAENLAMDLLERQSKRPNEHLPEDEWLKMPDHSPSIDDILHTKINAEQITQALAQLPPDEYELLMERYILGADIGTMAKLDGCSTGAMTTRLYRARQHAKELLSRKEQEVHEV